MEKINFTICLEGKPNLFRKVLSKGMWREDKRVRRVTLGTKIQGWWGTSKYIAKWNWRARWHGERFTNKSAQHVYVIFSAIFSGSTRGRNDMGSCINTSLYWSRRTVSEGSRSSCKRITSSSLVGEENKCIIGQVNLKYRKRSRN